MSYKTTTSQVFQDTVRREPKQRRVQDFTAITVDDPRLQEMSMAPDPPPEQTVVRVVEKDSNPKLDELMARQVSQLFRRLDNFSIWQRSNTSFILYPLPHSP